MILHSKTSQKNQNCVILGNPESFAIELVSQNFFRNDSHRNQFYWDALAECVKGKCVVDIGEGLSWQTEFVPCC